jgi:2-C-methyl-D-erythritol 4-phosphate cytidylyltransferase
LSQSLAVFYFRRMNSPSSPVLPAQRHFALIPAAGVGARAGAGSPKQYREIAGRAMLRHVLDTFASAPCIAHTFVVVNSDDAYIDEVVAGLSSCSVLRVGGATRQASVLNGLAAAHGQIGDDDWVLVHDAARPGLTTALIARLVDALANDPVGGLLALPMVDTLKRAGKDGRALQTVARDALWAAQTPQMFRHALLRRALEQAGDITDDASAIETLGLSPKLVEGSPRNFKVTLPHDFALAELYLKGLA